MKDKVSKLCFMFLTFITFIGCNISSSQMEGVYVAKNLVNHVDTLRILSNGTYVKNLYRKDDNSLIYRNTGKWKFKEGRVILENFLLDEDEDWSKDFDRFEDVLITSSLVPKRKLGKIVIYYRQLTDASYYEKQ